MKRPGTKTQIVLAGVALAVTAFALEWLEYKFFVRSISGEVYIFILVAFFTAIGIWVGHKLSGRGRQADTQGINEKALAALGITGREYAVLEQLAKGSSNKQIARDLGISPNTVKTHIANVYAKLKVNGRVQAVKSAQALKILPS